MSPRLLGWLLVVLLAPAVRADDEPHALVPPWGRDLEADHPVEEKMLEEAHAHGETLPRLWLALEYLHWWLRDDRAPFLLTSGLTTSPRPGALDQEGTKVRYGDAIDFEERYGGRFSFGTSLAPVSGWAVEGNYLFLTGRDVGVVRASLGNRVNARPFFDVLNQREDSSLVSYPGLLTGAIEIDSASHLHGAELNLVHQHHGHDKLHLEWLAGVRWLNLDEDLNIVEQNTLVAPVTGPRPLPAGTSITVGDEFAADNHFLGGQLGVRASMHWKRLRLGLEHKLALGGVRETVTIRGRTVIDDGTPEIFNAGLLALATNSGRHSRTRFAVLPEVAASLGLAITERLTFFTGYSFLYWSEVVRPGRHVDRNLNPNLIPTSASFGGPATPPRPAFRFAASDWCAHGLNFALVWRY
jgi:hypothetical protein